MLNIAYKYFFKKLLFLFSPEIAHKLVEDLLYFFPNNLFKLLFGYRFNPKTSIKLFNNEIPSPIGLAAGLDKNYKSTPNYLNLGFGFSVVGTVMIDPREGNPKPRVLRDKSNKELLNALSFPSDGSKAIIKRLNNNPSPKERLIISISGKSEEEIIQNLLLFQNYCFAIEINISSPNTSDLKKFVNKESINSIIFKVRNVTEIPIFIKLPRISDLEYYKEIIEPIEKNKNIGVVLSNTLPVEDKRLEVGKGGRSGQSLFKSTLEILKVVRKSYPNITIICSGGISTPEQVKVLIDEGANAIQIYTSLVYEGPGLIKDLNNNLK